MAKPKDPKKTPLTYKDAGVDIEAGNRLVEHIKPIARKTHRPGVIGGLGGFGSLFEIPMDRYKNPVLVAGTDGVGTKLNLAITQGVHHTIGIDLVAMCANDLIVQGAEPLFFLDYYATGKLELGVAKDVINGIGKGCELAGAALVGGETAEMPGMYQHHDYDLAGFCVGIVEKDDIIDGLKVRPGDKLVGLASSGPHSNGYSLIRKIIELDNTDLEQAFGGKTLGETLLEPTRIYVKSLLRLIKDIEVHAVAHITGGGLLENLPRVLPKGCQATLRRNSWQQPPIFDWLQEKGGISETEMLRTFNCGIGMVVCIAPNDLEMTLDQLSALGETPYVIGEIEPYPPNQGGPLLGGQGQAPIIVS